MKNIMTKNVHRLQNDLEVHLFQSIHDVIKEDIHPDIWRDFRSLEQMGVELHALLELASTEYATHSFKSVCLRALHA